MPVYIDILYKSFRQRWIYKTDTYILIFSTIIRIVIQIGIWTALFNKNAIVAGVTLDEMICYVFISTLISVFTSSGAGGYLGDRVKTGFIAIDFIRPVSLKYSLLAQDMGEHLYMLLFNIVPSFLFLGLVYRPGISLKPVNIALFAASVLLGIFIIFQIEYILGLFSFWLTSYGYIPWALSACSKLFSGAVVPLWFYPGAIRSAANVLPFKYTCFEPISILLGKMDVAGSCKVLLFQSAWIIALALVEKLVWAKVQKAVMVYGG